MLSTLKTSPHGKTKERKKKMMYAKSQKERTRPMLCPTTGSKARLPISLSSFPFPFNPFFLFKAPSSSSYSSQIMGRTSPRLPSFCLNRIIARVRVRSPPVEPKRISSATKPDRVAELSNNGEMQCNNGSGKPGLALGRRIMIIIDSTLEAKTALQWALSHTVQNHDTMILLSVIKPSKHGEDSSLKEINPRGYELLYAMKSICHNKKPEVQVEVSLVEGKDKGPTIVEEARKQGISLLVLGQRKRSTTWRLLMTWAGNRIGGGVVEYCIQNADCMALAVRRKSKKLGGYLITTKRHKDFWLLA